MMVVKERKSAFQLPLPFIAIDVNLIMTKETMAMTKKKTKK